MKTNALFIAVILLVVVAALVASSCGPQKESAPAEADTIDVALPQVADITLTTTYPGYLTANLAVDVVAKVNGQLTGKNYESGTAVTKGQTLFTIDPSTYRDRVEEARAQLTTAQSTRDYALAHYQAVKKALEADAVSKMEVAQSESAWREAEASIKSAQAELETAQRLLGYCTVTAPISGMAGDNAMSVGNYLSGEAQPVKLTTVYDNSSLSAHFSIDDDRFHDILVSEARRQELNFDSVAVTFDEPLPHTYTGAVSYFAPALNNSTGALELQCAIQNPWGELRPGMYVKVDLPYERVERAVLVRNDAISSDQRGKFLYTVNDSNRVVYTPVTLGELYHDSLRVVTTGLEPGRRYVTKALLKVRSGETVVPRLTD